MKNITIICDSCSSLNKKQAQDLNVKVIPALITIDDKIFNPLDENMISFEEFYEKLENKVYSKTSCVNPEAFINAFTPELEAGNDIIYIPLSKGLSASSNNAIMVKNMLISEYPDSKIEVADPFTGSLGIQIAIMEAIKLKNEGKSVEEIKAAIDNNAIKIKSLFTIGSLDHLRRGGRLSKISAILGTLLHINPIISVDDNGKLCEHSKHRGRKKAISTLLNSAISNALDGSTIYVGHTNCLDEAMNMKKYIEENSNFNVVTGYIDYTMGSHCGPKTLAIFYKEK